MEHAKQGEDRTGQDHHVPKCTASDTIRYDTMIVCVTYRTDRLCSSRRLRGQHPRRETCGLCGSWKYFVSSWCLVVRERRGEEWERDEEKDSLWNVMIVTHVRNGQLTVLSGTSSERDSSAEQPLSALSNAFWCLNCVVLCWYLEEEIRFSCRFSPVW